MKILALKLAGPLQSWGYDSRFARRSTSSYPTLSGVIGLLANALGITREEQQRLVASGLLGLTIAVRVDRPGSLLSDYQTVQINKAGNKKLLSRVYVQDAVFLAGVYDLTGESNALLEDLASALKRPKHPLFLGRKSCIPDPPILLGVKNAETISQFLQTEPWLGSKRQLSRRQRSEEKLSMLTVSTDPEGSLSYPDQPLSFSNELRQYASRTVKEAYVSISNPYWEEPDEELKLVQAAGSMDPIGEL